MTQITDDVFAVEVPGKVENLNLYRVNNYAIMLEWDDVERPLNPHTCVKVDEHYGDLKEYTWPKILCTTREASEDIAKGIVEYDKFIDGYKDYDTDNFHHDTPFIKAVDSLNSLITSKGLDPNKNYVLLKKM